MQTQRDRKRDLMRDICPNTRWPVLYEPPLLFFFSYIDLTLKICFQWLFLSLSRLKPSLSPSFTVQSSFPLTLLSFLPFSRVNSSIIPFPFKARVCEVIAARACGARTFFSFCSMKMGVRISTRTCRMSEEEKDALLTCLFLQGLCESTSGTTRVDLAPEQVYLHLIGLVQTGKK